MSAMDRLGERIRAATARYSKQYESVDRQHLAGVMSDQERIDIMADIIARHLCDLRLHYTVYQMAKAADDMRADLTMGGRYAH